MKYLNLVDTKAWIGSLALVGLAALITGCAEPQTSYVPVYHVQPTYVVQQPYPPTVVYAVQPAPPQPVAGSVPIANPAAPTTDWQPPPAPPAPAQVQAPPPPPPAAPPQKVVLVPTAPPPLLVEARPLAPGPYYVWISGYWAWNGNWVWGSGHWAARPRPTAIWVSGHWAPHGHGYVWVAGGWR
ncbi:MAG: YXWGXW repeat-containing protein [Verrucomicrobia bacterium]|nr:YXWGXW repeat-containing protein [Verrucomicrobiota bacterium]